MNIEKFSKRKSDVRNGESVLLLYFLFIVYIVFLIKTAWISDDCLLTCRTIYNFVHGYGLTWNTAERVQAFTHPLWLLLITPFYGITHEFSNTIMLISIIVSGIAVYWMVFKISQNYNSSVVCLTLILFSKPFVDFSTSGLENPLSHLLFILYGYILSRNYFDEKNLFFASLLFALALVTRIDVIILYVPVFISIVINSKKQVKNYFKILIAGLLPILIWELFSFVYYGYLLPNTYYAKTHTGIPSYELFIQGYFYFLDSLSKDYVTLPCIIMAVVYSLKKRHDPHSLWLSAGILLYMVYVVSVAGDFMRGRFLTLPFLVSVFIISRIAMNGKTTFGFVSIIVLSGLYSENPSISSKSNYVNKESNFGIVDERGYYYMERSLLNTSRDTFFKRELIAKDNSSELEIIVVAAGAGIKGLSAGPYKHLLDQCALGDPLLSKLTINDTDKKYWRTGHYIRDIPLGYSESIKEDKNYINDKSLHVYYDKLRQITRGDLFSFSRIMTILAMNLGYFDNYIYRYNHRTEICTALDLSEVNSFLDGVSWQDIRCHVFYQSGILIDLKTVHTNQKVKISLDNNDLYELIFYNREKEIAKITVGPDAVKFGVANYDVPIPEDIYKNGYNKIKIIPINGDGIYSIGHLLFP